MAAPVYSKTDSKTKSTPLPLPTSSRNRTYHPLFACPDADVVLRSTEGTLYRIDSFTLRNTCGLFNTMFCLPQPKSQPLKNQNHRNNVQEVELDVYESDFPMEKLLMLLCGMPVPKWESFDDVERILAIAEKWDAPGPISSIRSALTSPHFLQSYPLRLYALAKHFDWKEEAKIASAHTLTLNIHDPAHSHILEQMTSKDLLPLLTLHRKRRDQFRLMMDSPERFTAGNSSPYHCSRCGVTQLDNHTWRELKNRMFLEMDSRPLGDRLGQVTGPTADWPESLACWEAQCIKEGCGGLNYDRVATLRQIRNCIDVLPMTIED